MNKVLIYLFAIAAMGGCGEREQLPASIAEANLPKTGWTPEQQKLVAKITLRRSYQIATALESAVNKGDMQLAGVGLYSALDDVTAFYSAGMYADIGKPYRNCILMLQNQVEAAQRVTQGGKYMPEQTEAARSACLSEIG